VEGGVEMDEQGEGFVNMGAVKVIQNTLFMFRLPNAKLLSKLRVGRLEEPILTEL
jgi:hypothetical protein